MRRTNFAVFVFFLFAMTVTSLALGQTSQGGTLQDGEGLNSQVLWKTPGPSNFSFLQSSDVLENRNVSFGAVSQYYRKPLGLEIGGDVSWSVKRVTSLDFSWAVGLIDRIQIGMVLPVVIAQSGVGASPLKLKSVDNDEKIAGAAVGDLRIHAKIQAYRQYPGKNRGVGVAMDVALSMPSGDEYNFAGENGVVFAPLLILDFRRHFLSAGTNVGVRLRSGDKAYLADSSVGNQLTYGIGGTLHMFSEKLLVSSEMNLLAEMDDFNRMGLEFRGAIGTISSQIPSLGLWLSGCAGISNKENPVLSVPQMRFTLGLTYQPEFNNDVSKNRPPRTK